MFLLTASRAPAAPRSRPAGGGGVAAAQVEELNAQVLEKNLTIEGLEKERDFYFGKLRDIEIIVQEFENVEGAAEFGQKVLGVLYATEVLTTFDSFETSFVLFETNFVSLYFCFIFRTTF